MKFQARAPNPELRSAVDCIWTLEANPDETAGAIEPVLPDGCPELVLQFGDRFERVYEDGRFERQSDLVFAGQLTSQVSLRPTGTVATLGVRFRPGSAAALLHMPQHSLLGTTHGVDALDDRLARDLAAIRDRARSMDDAVDQVQQYLFIRMDLRWSDPGVLAAVETIRRHGGQMAIDDLATRIGMTRRHLERRFDTFVGISPKRLARIVRFQRALRMLHARPERPGLQRPAGNGATTAIECGYADQPHFIREFTELAGCSPGAHLLRHAELSGFFTRA